MLTQEFNNKLASAALKFEQRAYEDMLKTVHAMHVCPCGNLQALWMFALESYDPTPGKVNALTERQVHALFCRMKAEDSGVAVPPVVTPPVTVVFEADLLWTTEDPMLTLEDEDFVTYNKTIEVVEGRDIVFSLTGLPAERYLVVRYPDTESVKTSWYHDIFNYGVIEDSVFRPVLTARGSLYIVTRNPVTFYPDKTLKFT